MTYAPFISIIVVTYNSETHLSRCLNALVLQTHQNFEIILIDNGSSDNSLSVADAYHAQLQLKIIRLETNKGFATANNLGAKIARGVWLVLLNADAFPQADWLKKLLQAAEEHPEFAAFSSKQILANQPQTLDGAGDVYHISGIAWRRYFGLPVEYYGQESCEIFSPCAAAAMYRRDCFLEVGGFDEDFFAYYEDLDLGFRMRLMGYRALYVPQAVVIHVGSSTFGAHSEFTLYHSHRNLVWTFIKNMPGLLFWKYLPAHIFANLLAMTYSSLHLPAKAIWKAKLDALRGLQTTIHKRKHIQKLRRATIGDIENVLTRGLLTPYTLRRSRKR